MDHVAQKFNLPSEIIENIYKELHKLYMKYLSTEIEVTAIRFKIRSLFKYLPFSIDEDEAEIDIFINVHYDRSHVFMRLLDDIINPHDLQYILIAMDIHSFH